MYKPPVSCQLIFVIEIKTKKHESPERFGQIDAVAPVRRVRSYSLQHNLPVMLIVSPQIFSDRRLKAR